jgi:hypothetical protein
MSLRSPASPAHVLPTHGRCRQRGGERKGSGDVWPARRESGGGCLAPRLTEGAKLMGHLLGQD